jgi:hypothetical protein
MFLWQIQILPQEKGNTNDTTFVMQKSPWGAVLRSAIIPGLGQIYNESYWKAPVIWGISAWLVYNWIDNNKDYKTYRDLYLNNINNTTISSRLLRTYRDNRVFYRDQ